MPQHMAIKDKGQWNDSTRHCSHKGAQSSLTWWIGTTSRDSGRHPRDTLPMGSTTCLLQNQQ
eukprot:5685131-Amphidinium_carterae.1